MCKIFSVTHFLIIFTVIEAKHCLVAITIMVRQNWGRYKQSTWNNAGAIQKESHLMAKAATGIP